MSTPRLSRMGAGSGVGVMVGDGVAVGVADGVSVSVGSGVKVGVKVGRGVQVAGMGVCVGGAVPVAKGVAGICVGEQPTSKAQSNTRVIIFIRFMLFSPLFNCQPILGDFGPGPAIGVNATIWTVIVGRIYPHEVSEIYDCLQNVCGTLKA